MSFSLPPSKHEKKEAAESRIDVLDGFRGLAILLVLLFHFGAGINRRSAIDDWFGRITGSMWTGVDVFFVLSGFLITGILLKTRDRKHYFRSFYMRRTLRIFPLYYGFLFLCFFVFPLFGMEFRHADGQTWWYVFYLSNVRQAFYGFDHGVLSVMWSLAIEEQFYLVWPLIVWALPRRVLIGVLTAILALSIAGRWFVFWKTGDPVFVYFFTLTRLDPIVAGSLIAAYCAGDLSKLMPLRRSAILACVASFAILVTMYTNRAGMVSFNWSRFQQATGFFLIAMCVAALLIVVLTEKRGSWMQKLFCSRFLCFFGKYSYALYVFHMLVAFLAQRYFMHISMFPPVFGSSLPLTLWYIFIATVVTIFLSLLSWNAYEKHFLKLKDRFVPK